MTPHGSGKFCVSSRLCSSGILKRSADVRGLVYELLSRGNRLNRNSLYSRKVYQPMGGLSRYEFEPNVKRHYPDENQ
jgi:hypothetical protein